MPVKMTFKLGSYSNLNGRSAAEGLNVFMNGLEDLAFDGVVQASSVNVPGLQRRLDRTVARSMQSAVNHAQLNIMGTLSTSGTDRSPTQIYFEMTGGFEERDYGPRAGAAFVQRNKKRLRGVDKIEWDPLSTRARLAKIKSGKSRTDALRHYVDTGALRKELRGLAANITQQTGTVKIGYIKKQAKKFGRAPGRNTRVTVGQMQLTFLPNVPLRNLPGLRTGDVTKFDEQARFEQSLGLSAESVKKLRGWSAGGRSVHRPLLQPMITYWMLNKTPMLVASAIERSISRK